MHGTISCLSRLALRYLPLNRRTHAQQTRHSASAFTILFPPLCAPPFVTLLLDNASTSSNHTVAQCSGNSGRVSVERPMKHQRNPQINCRDKPHKNLYPTNHTEHRDKNHHANYENVQASCSRVSGQLPSQCSYRRFFMFLRPYRCEPQSRIHRDVCLPREIILIRKRRFNTTTTTSYVRAFRVCFISLLFCRTRLLIRRCG